MDRWRLEAPPGFEPGMELLQSSALPLGYGADDATKAEGPPAGWGPPSPPRGGYGELSPGLRGVKDGAGNGIRTRDFDLGKVALYH